MVADEQTRGRGQRLQTADLVAEPDAPYEEPRAFLLRQLGESCRLLTEYPALFGGLPEESISQVLALLLSARLRGFGASATAKKAAGHGKQATGEADLQVRLVTQFADSGPLLSAEAKIWGDKRGAAHVSAGLGQLFGVSSTRGERVLALIVYSKLARFSDCVDKVEAMLASFELAGGDGRALFERMEGPTAEPSLSSATLRVLRTRHHASVSCDDESPGVDVHTFVVDVLAEPARAARRTTAVPSRGSGRKT